jgi:quinol monooxygenase YgiN
MSKIAIVAKVVAAEGRADELFARLGSAVASVEQEAGTEVYSVHRDTKDRDVAWLFELYTDREALDAHQRSAPMRAMVRDLRLLTRDGGELHILDSVAAKGLVVDIES